MAMASIAFCMLVITRGYLAAQSSPIGQSRDASCGGCHKGILMLFGLSLAQMSSDDSHDCRLIVHN